MSRADNSLVMPPSPVLSMLPWNHRGSVAALIAAALLGVSTVGLALATDSRASGDYAPTSSVEEPSKSEVARLSEMLDLRVPPADSALRKDKYELEGSTIPSVPAVPIPINQDVIVWPQGVEALLPSPVKMPVETEWVAGFSIARLSKAKVAEILAKASALKDIEPFAEGSGPNSNERLPAWLASDRTVIAGTPRAYAVLMLVNYGWGLDQWPYLDRMWWHESGWDPQTVDQQQGNEYGELDPTKTWGIPQANPASKMASAGDDWMTNPETQIRWGLGYIQSSYGSPQQAWEAWRKRAATGSYGWY